MVDSTGLEPVTPCTSSIMGLPPQSIDISRVSATFGNLFPRWRSVLLDGYCATQKDIA